MGKQQFAMDYIDVATRLVEFREKHPEGSLQPADPIVPYRVEQIGDQTYIVVVAAAYRSAADARPGIGMAYEVFPGRTPYTKGSELQNAETSAWGRAIVAALAADTRQGVASAEEVRNRDAERQEQAVDPRTEAANRVWRLVSGWGWDKERLVEDYSRRFGTEIGSADAAQLGEYHAELLAERESGAKKQEEAA